MNGISSLLRNRQYLLLWLVNITTTLAVELFSVTVLVAIFQQTESTLQAAGVLVARGLAVLLLGPVAGVFIDRFPRKNVLILMDILRLGLIAAAVGLLQGGGQIPVFSIYLVIAGLTAASVFHQPARLALIPSLVSTGHLVQANSFILASNQIMMAVSYTLGGWLVLYLPLQQVVVGVMGLFLLAIFTTARMAVPGRLQPGPLVKKESFWNSLVTGWQYLRAHPIARPLTIMETIEHVPHGIWTSALMLAFTIQALQSDATGWGYQVTGYFSGMIAGSLAALGLDRWLRRYPGWIIAYNALAAGVFTLAYALSPSVSFAVFLAFLFGPPMAIRDVAQDALLQGTVEADQLGRVYAAREVLRNGVFMLAGLFFAWLSEQIPIRQVYLLGGIFYLLTGLYALSSKALRQSQMQPEAVQPADAPGQ